METKISDGGVKGMAVIGGSNSRIKAVGEYVICRIEEGNAFSRGGLVIPDGPNQKFVVESVGEGVTLDIEKGDVLIVATLTEIPIWNPEMGQEERFSVYGQKQIMGVIKK